jgi:hypothetical protein
MMLFLKHIIAVFHILLVFSSFAQTPVTISGYVTDASSGDETYRGNYFYSRFK